MSLGIILLESGIEEEGNGVVTSEIDNIPMAIIAPAPYQLGTRVVEQVQVEDWK